MNKETAAVYADDLRVTGVCCRFFMDSRNILNLAVKRLQRVKSEMADGSSKKKTVMLSFYRPGR